MKKILYILSIILFVSQLSAQNVEFEKKNFKSRKDAYKIAKKNLEEGNELYEQNLRGSFKMAIDFYLKANQFNPDNALLNFKIGLCYLQSVSQEKALDFLIKAEKINPHVSPKIDYMKGKAYQYNLKFEEAKKSFTKYKNRLSPKDANLYRKKIQRRLNECNTAIELIKEPVRAFIDNAGDNINSSYPDYSPLITADGSMMIFTSRREGTTGEHRSEQDGQWFEDIYISYNNNGEWSKAVNIGKPLNTKDNDATVGLSPDGQKLFTYSGKTNGGDIFESELDGSEWSKPDDGPLKKHINTDYHESAASFSFDGKTMYYATNNPENSFGMHDIYMSYWNDDKERWGPPTNLGSAINTEYDEKDIFVHPDGRTIFFSSTGHNTMGGFDIFKTTRDDEGTWSEPKNIGYPINTPGDDRFFVMDASGKKGFYASDKTGGLGAHDMYIITFLGPVKPMIQSNDNILIASIANPITETFVEKSVDVATMRLTILKGKILDAFTNKPVAATIEIVDNEKNQVISVSKSNRVTGAYLVSLPSGKNYGIAVKSEGYLFHSENFNIPNATNYQEISKDILLNKMAVGTKIVLKNIFFDYAKATLKPVSFPELERLVKLLNQFPTLRIEISGHTDNKGSMALNKKLSKSRAKSVVDHLISKGIDAGRLEFEGYAYLQPIATNKTNEGRQQNRRVEFKVLSE